MDFIELIKSRDVKKYLRETNYKLNILQCAFLVWHQDTNWSIIKKMQAYKYLIDNYEDMPIDTTDYFDGMAKHYDSFKEVLRETIKRVLSEIKEFLGGCGENDVFKIFVSGKLYEFKTFDDAVEFLIDNKQAIKNERGNYYIYKYDKNDSSFKGQVKLDDDYQICLSNETSRDEQSKTLYNIFNYMNVSIPTPFKRGDVIEYCGVNTYLHKFNTYYCIDTINTWGTKEAKENGIIDPKHNFDKNLKWREQHGRADIMMNFDGYAVCSIQKRDENGKGTGEVAEIHLVHDYDEWPLLIDMEYADIDSLVGAEKVILLVSEYIKTDDKYHKRMDIESILYYYDMVMYEDKNNVECDEAFDMDRHERLYNSDQIKSLVENGICSYWMRLQGYEKYRLKNNI